MSFIHLFFIITCVIHIHVKCDSVHSVQVYIGVDPIVAMNSLDFITLLCIASPHILYAAIWYLPEIWRAQFGRDSVLVFAHVATAGKGVPQPDSLPCPTLGQPCHGCFPPFQSSIAFSWS